MSDNVTVDPVVAAIAAAQLAAQASIAKSAGAIAVPAAANSNAVVPVRPGVPLSMDDMGSTLVVDGWLGVSADGFKVGKDKALYTDDIIVDIDLTAVLPCYAIKYGNPAMYAKTYDRVTSARGGSWADEVVKANRVDSNAREYPSADLPMTLVNPIVVKKEIIHDAGAVLGNSLSTTNWKNWQGFWNLCKSRGLTGGVVRVRLGYEKRRNSANNIWGVLTFNLEAADQAAA